MSQELARSDKKKEPDIRPAPREHSAGYLGLAEQVGHGVGGGVAGMIQAGELESAFDGSEQGEVSVEDFALQVVEAIVGVNDGRDLVDGGRDAVVILVPDGDDGVVAVLPNGRGMDGADDALKSLIT